MYTEAEQGDHFLAFKNPVKFTKDLEEFLDGKASNLRTIEEESDVMNETLLNTTTAWDGAPYIAYPQGEPELTVLKITVQAHGELAWHTHPVPSATYIVSGEVTVEEMNGTKRHFTAGQVIPETVGTLHHGVIGDVPAVFIVFYPGVKGLPVSQ